VLREHETTTSTPEVGRRVFIKGLAATGALVGGLAVGGPALADEARGVPARGRGGRPSPFSQGWTSQPGMFYDDVSLPDGFTYDVVASYRDRIGGGEYFGYNNDFIAYFPLRTSVATRKGCSGSTTSTPTRSSSTATPTPRPRPPARSSWSSTRSAARSSASR
jgi:secreted PhoX family phosphatase